jgi:hypothetical protein
MASPKDIPAETISIYTVGNTTYCLSQSEKKLSESVNNGGWSLAVAVGFAKPETGVAYAQLGEKVCSQIRTLLFEFVANAKSVL